MIAGPGITDANGIYHLGEDDNPDGTFSGLMQLVTEPISDEFTADRARLDTLETPNAWAAYTPTLTNITLGTGGTVTGEWIMGVGEVLMRVVITLGSSGFAVSAGAKFSTPVTIAAAVVTEVVEGELSIRDVSGNITTIGKLQQLTADTDKLTLAYFGASNVLSQVTSAVPITMQAGDVLVARCRAKV